MSTFITPIHSVEFRDPERLSESYLRIWKLWNRGSLLFPNWEILPFIPLAKVYRYPTCTKVWAFLGWKNTQTPSICKYPSSSSSSPSVLKINHQIVSWLEHACCRFRAVQPFFNTKYRRAIHDIRQNCQAFNSFYVALKVRNCLIVYLWLFIESYPPSQITMYLTVSQSVPTSLASSKNVPLLKARCPCYAQAE